VKKRLTFLLFPSLCFGKGKNFFGKAIPKPKIGLARLVSANPIF
jgi:hypothetical protein